MNDWLQSSLVCPRDKSAMELSSETLTCEKNHSFPIFDGIPILLVDGAETTHPYVRDTTDRISHWQSGKELKERHGAGGEVDAFVQHEIPFTSGFLYHPVQYKLTRYPIPSLRLPHGEQKRFLDVGCNWGRWSIAAAKIGYKPVGIDPGIDAVLSARRVARQLNVDASFVVGDARFLPFADSVFDTAFSHSVFPSFSKENVRLSLSEVSRVLKPHATSLMQMPNKYGLRQYQQRRRRGFTEGKNFETRYWSPSELMKTFEEKIGKTKMTTDCFFGLGIQPNDVDLLPLKYKAVVYSSEIMRKVSEVFTPLTKVADSVYLESVNQK